MKELLFSIPYNFTGRFISNIQMGEKEHLLLHAYVPGIAIIDAGTFDKDVSFIIEHIESSKQKIKQQKQSITIYDTWNNKISQDLYHLLYGITRRHYLANNLFPVHAASVGVNSLVLLVGHSGVGKTTIATELINNGMKLYAGNKTVVSFEKGGALDAIAGTISMTVRTDSALSFTEGIPYGERTVFQLPEEKYIAAKPISSIVLPTLNDGMQQWRQLTPQSALHTLYPYFLDTVNADVIIANNIFDGSPSVKTRKYLAEKLKNIVEHIPVYTAVGSLSFITDKLGVLDL